MFLNTPDAVYDRAISTDQAEEALHRDIKDVVRHIISTDNSASVWNGATDDSIVVTTLTGGITNVLFMVEVTTTGDRVIVRLYGNGTSRFIDRAVENIVFSCFSKWNVGPTFYGRFENGRVEGYLPATALESEEMRRDDVYPHIAKAVADLHTLSIPEIKTEGWLWSKIRSFILLTEGGAGSESPAGLGCSSDIQMSTVAHELAWLEGFVGEREGEGGESARARGRRCGFGVVLCHNDLLSGNILLSNQYQAQAQCQRATSSEGSYDGQAVYLIDYEYAACNYRAYDIANHLSEHCGFEYDLARTFPSDAFMLAFLRQYMQSLCLQQQPDEMLEEEFLLGLLDSVRWLLLASHLFWGSWSTVQAQSSAIDFDYAGYAQRRFKAYFLHKEAFSVV